MNKLLSLLVVSFLLASVKLAQAVSINSWQMEEVTLASETITGSCYIKAVYLSTATNNTIMNTAYAVLVASPSSTPNATFEAYTSDQKITPPLVFASTNAVNVAGNLGGLFKAIEFPDDGVFVSTDCTLWKTNVASGEAFKAFILYRK